MDDLLKSLLQSLPAETSSTNVSTKDKRVPAAHFPADGVKKFLAAYGQAPEFEVNDPGFAEYFPNADYKKKDWAGERVFPKDIEELGRAAKRAVDAGVLTKSEAMDLLPLSLVEGRFRGEDSRSMTDYGVNTYKGRPAFSKIAEAVFGASPLGKDGTLNDWPDFTRSILHRAGMLADNEQMSPELIMALSAASILGDMRAQHGSNAIERWNGQGSGVMEDGTRYDSKNSVRKFDAMKEMLGAPENTEVVTSFKKGYARGWKPVRKDLDYYMAK